MFKRKIQQKLIEWSSEEKHHPLIISGLRQVGKTTSVLEFAKNYKKNVVYIDFRENKNAQLAFNGNFNVDEITSAVINLRKRPLHSTDVIIRKPQPTVLSKPKRMNASEVRSLPEIKSSVYL